MRTAVFVSPMTEGGSSSELCSLSYYFMRRDDCSEGFKPPKKVQSSLVWTLHRNLRTPVYRMCSLIALFRSIIVITTRCSPCFSEPSRNLRRHRRARPLNSTVQNSSCYNCCAICVKLMRLCCCAIHATHQVIWTNRPRDLVSFIQSFIHQFNSGHSFSNPS